MGQTLTHGVYLPNEGERNCYSGLAANWRLLDGAIGTVAAHTTAIAGKADISHSHGNISNDGKVGTTANLPLITGTGGAVQAGSFGTSANTFCEGNDSRLSDARTPVVHTHTKSNVTDLLNSDFIPSANNSYDLGSSSYQWNNLYAKNYYYNGTAWGLDKVNEWSDANYFNKTLFCDFSNLADKAIPNAYIQDVLIIAEGNTSPKTWHSGIALERYTNGDEGFQFLTCSYVNGTTQQLGALRYLVSGDGTESYCYARGPAKQHLGTSTNKWTTLNGVNPGALSLPDYDRFEPIDFSQFDVNLGWNNLYTPSEDGWLYAEINDTATNSIYIYSSGLQPVQSVNRKYGVSAQGNGSQQTGYGGGLAVMIPVRKNVQYRFLIKASAVSDIYVVIFYPCLGNV